MPTPVFDPHEIHTASAECALGMAIFSLLLCNFMIAVDVHFWLLCAFLRDRLFPSVDATEDDDEIALCELGGPLSRFALESTSRFLRDLLILLVDAGIVVDRESWDELCPLQVWSAVCWSWMLLYV